METETTNTTESTATNGTTATAPVVEVAASVAFTQEQVNAIVQQRLAEDRARRTKEPVVAPKPEPKVESKTSKTDEVSAMQSKLEELTLRMTFDKRAAKLDLTDSAGDRLFKLYKDERPADTAAWLDEVAKEFRLTPQVTVTPTATTVATHVETKPVAAAPNAAAKVETITTDGLPSILRMTDAQLTQLGPQGVRAEFEKSMQIDRQNSGAPPRPKIAQRK